MSDPQSPPAQLINDAFQIANDAAVATIECEGIEVQLTTPTEHGLVQHKWWDTRPMLDLDRNAPDFVDANAQVLRYALAAGLVHAHTDEPHLVRIAGR